MQILLTNDDGIDAPGLAALRASLDLVLADRQIDARVVTVAPDRGRSECGHSVTNGVPLQLNRIGPDCYSLNGTPVDCVRVAIGTLIGDADVVLSGVNAGANLGVDLLVSGTFAAAREAASQGIPAMAISHYRRPDVAKTWDHVPQWSRTPLKEFLDTGRRSATSLWNLNFPATDADGPIPQTVECEVDRHPMTREATSYPEIGCDSVGHNFGVTFELDFHGRPRQPGSDVDQCFAGKTTLSKLAFNVV